MAIQTGVRGDVTNATGDGVDAFIFQWSADFQREVFDISNFDDDTNARFKLGGMYHLVGTCQAYLDNGAPPAIADFLTEDFIPTATIVLQTFAAKTYTFKAIISNMNVAMEKRGQSIVTLSFESSEAVTAASA